MRALLFYLILGSRANLLFISGGLHLSSVVVIMELVGMEMRDEAVQEGETRHHLDGQEWLASAQIAEPTRSL